MTWERPALALVLIGAAALNFWQLSLVGYGNTYYAAAVRSMAQNWHAFFFNSFDSTGFVSIDKPPLGFWIQVASVKLFGFSGISLMLPQAIAGVLSVAVLFHLVRRVFGPVAGLLAALALAIMPVSVAASRNNIIDGLLVLTVLLAAWAVTRAAETGRLTWLLLCAVLVGLGFNVKMLEAYLVVPAFGLMYLFGAPVSWRARFGHLAVATVVMLAISMSWVAAVDLTPAGARPYVGSSGTNSAFNLALGYNGVNRLTGNVLNRGPRGQTGGAGANAPNVTRATLGGFTRGETGNPGPLRLFNDALGAQVSWLLPLSVAGLVFAGLQTRRRFPLDRRGKALVMWGTWLLTQAIFFSIAGFFHTYYMVMMAPSIAALAGIGIVALWQDYRRSSRRGWLLVPALIGTAVVQGFLLAPYPDWSRWLTPLIAGMCAIAAVVLVLARLTARLRRPVAVGAVALGVLALLAAPAAWSVDTVGASGGLIPRAGPSPQTSRSDQTGGGRRAFPGGGFGSGGFQGGFPGNEFGRSKLPGGQVGPGAGDAGSTADARLLSYLTANRGRTSYLLAVMNAMSASPFILATAQPVMALGGFSGQDRIVTPDDLAQLVAHGAVRFFLVPGAGTFSPADLPSQFRQFFGRQAPSGGGLFGFGGAGANGDLTQWIGAHCSAVPSSAWQTAPSGSTGGTGFGGFFGRGGAQQLYDCARSPAVPAAAVNGPAGAASPAR